MSLRLSLRLSLRCSKYLTAPSLEHFGDTTGLCGLAMVHNLAGHSQTSLLRNQKVQPWYK